jgi:hypothetical protein
VFGACLGREDGGASLFVSDLTGQAAVTPLCKGLTFVVYGGPKVENSPVNASATYTLIPDYTPGQKQQTWDLSGSKGHSLSVRGEGTAREIIRDVCNAIKGHGAKVIQ